MDYFGRNCGLGFDRLLETIPPTLEVINFEFRSVANKVTRRPDPDYPSRMSKLPDS